MYIYEWLETKYFEYMQIYNPTGIKANAYHLKQTIWFIYMIQYKKQFTIFHGTIDASAVRICQDQFCGHMWQTKNFNERNTPSMTELTCLSTQKQNWSCENSEFWLLCKPLFCALKHSQTPFLTASLVQQHWNSKKFRPPNGGRSIKYGSIKWFESAAIQLHTSGKMRILMSAP